MHWRGGGSVDEVKRGWDTKDVRRRKRRFTQRKVVDKNRKRELTREAESITG